MQKCKLNNDKNKFKKAQLKHTFICVFGRIQPHKNLIFAQQEETKS